MKDPGSAVDWNEGKDPVFLRWHGEIGNQAVPWKGGDLIQELEIWYHKFLKEGKSRIIKEWMERWGAINRRVLIRFDAKVIEGIAFRIDENGHLLVKKDDGTTEKIIAGDLILL